MNWIEGYCRQDRGRRAQIQDAAGSLKLDEKILGFVMSGGVGSRLWPLSREDNPKQFHALSGADTMLVKTVNI